MKKLLALFVILMFIGIALMPAINSKINVTKKQINFLSDKSKLPLIHLEASNSYEYGLKVGRRFRLMYTLINIVVELTKKNSISKEDIDEQIYFMKQNCPFFLDELRGLSDGLNIKLDRLIYLQSFFLSRFNHECTVTLATGDATKYNESFLTFNVDTSIGIGDTISTFLHRLFAIKFWIVRVNTIRYKYAFWGVPIIYEFPFLNEKGLGWGSPGTRLTSNQSRYIDEGPGISTMMLERLTMMTCKDVYEAADLYKNMERASQKDKGWFHQYDSSSSCYCDKKGRILIIEQTHNHIKTVFGNSTEITGAPKNILWHANHHQWLDPNLTGSVFPNEYLPSAYRADRALELLINNYGNITLDVCKSITRDHDGGFNKNGKDPGDICRHPNREDKRVTAYSWIIQPKNLTVYWTFRSPCRGIYLRYDFSRNFRE